MSYAEFDRLRSQAYKELSYEGFTLWLDYAYNLFSQGDATIDRLSYEIKRLRDWGWEKHPNC